MAVRSAFSLGLHREEALVVFPPRERENRRQVWKSLFILDRFSAITLGRPFAIDQEACTGDAIDPPWDLPNPSPSSSSNYNIGLEAGVRGCRFMAIVIKKIYQQRTMSTKVARELADLCKIYPRNLPRSLHWRRATPNDRRQAMVILHVNTIYCFSVLLFTRPFFVHIFRTEMERIYLGCAQQDVTFNKMEKYSEACVVAAIHMIALIQNAYDGGYFPRRDPFAITGLFTAAIVLLAGKFTPRTTHASSNRSVDSAIAILNYCAQDDPQAAKMCQVCDEFKQALYSEDGGQQATPESVPETMGAPSNDIHVNAADPLPLSSSYNLSDPMDSPFPLQSVAQDSVHLTAGEQTTSASNFPLLQDQALANDAFPGFLDLEDAIFTTASDDSYQGTDEQIDFDKLWTFPSAYDPSLSSPNFQNMGIQDISNSAVPMFCTEDLAGQFQS